LDSTDSSDNDNNTTPEKIMKSVAGYSGTEGMSFAWSTSHIYDKCFLEASS